MNVVQQLLDVLDAVGLVQGHLFARVPADGNVLTRLHVPGSDLEPDWNTLEFPVVELPSGRIIFSIVAFHPDPGLDQGILVLLAGGVQAGSFVVLEVDGDAAGNDGNLNLRKYFF